MSKEFNDHFSIQSSDYASFRPDYPPSLFEYLVTLVPSSGLAWDCATGNGQAALALTHYFGKVIATDASKDQLIHAALHQGIDYRVATAESSGLENGSVDLVTVAQALHWFDFDRFNKEVKRVLKPSGVLAVWTYGLAKIEEEIDVVVDHFYSVVLKDYWPRERRYVEEKYCTIPFPFMELSAPSFKVEKYWNLSQFVGYLNSWSAVQKFIQEKGFNPVVAVEEKLLENWSESKSVIWPLTLRVGRN